MEYRNSHPWITFQLDLRNAPARFWMLLGAACSKCEQIASVPLLPDTAERLHQLYLERGVRATTAIEGNTLSEQEISKLARGELDLPPSKQYLGIEVQNILDACNDMLDEIRRGAAPTLDARRVKDINRMTLSGLDIILSDEVAPGEIRSHEVGVLRYRGAPARDCEYLTNRMCQWLDGMSFDLGSPLAAPILKAILAHLYLAWIHPFGDGNGRTARLLEYQILLSAGVPSPAGHLLSNHYNDTRSEYYRRLDRSSRVRGGDMEFIVYALQGFVDGLDSQIEEIREQILDTTWTNYVHAQFADKSGAVDTRRRHLALDLSKSDAPVPRAGIRTLTPRLAEAYLNRTAKTITRDVNYLKRMGLILEGKDGITANKRIVLSLLP